MTIDQKTQALMADVDAIRDRIEQQLAKDPTHEVALAMFEADRRRAELLLMEHMAVKEGRRVA